MLLLFTIHNCVLLEEDLSEIENDFEFGWNFIYLTKSESGAWERLLRNIRRRFSKQISRDCWRGLRCGFQDFIYQGIQVKQIESHVDISQSLWLL